MVLRVSQSMTPSALSDPLPREPLRMGIQLKPVWVAPAFIDVGCYSPTTLP